MPWPCHAQTLCIRHMRARTSRAHARARMRMRARTPCTRQAQAPNHNHSHPDWENKGRRNAFVVAARSSTPHSHHDKQGQRKSCCCCRTLNICHAQTPCIRQAKAFPNPFIHSHITSFILTFLIYSLSPVTLIFPPSPSALILPFTPRYVGLVARCIRRARMRTPRAHVRAHTRMRAHASCINQAHTSKHNLPHSNCDNRGQRNVFVVAAKPSVPHSHH